MRKYKNTINQKIFTYDVMEIKHDVVILKNQINGMIREISRKEFNQLCEEQRNANRGKLKY